MSDAIYTAYDALESRMRLVDVIANNLANVETTGFKRDFAHVLEAAVSATGTSIEVVSALDLTPGILMSTGRDLDAAIDGSGFFVVETENGPRYTRNGSFQLSADGELVLQDGRRVLGAGDSPIVVGSGTVSVRDGGEVELNGSVVATLRIVDFDDPRFLRKEGMLGYEWTGDPSGVSDVLEPRVKGGHLEKSNVNSINEMVDLMGTFREFESITQAIRAISTEMDRQLLAELSDLT